MKYQGLKSYLAAQRKERIRMSFAEIARCASVKLPASAFEHAAWWANHSKSHVQAKAWLEAGYKTENVDIAAQTVEFVKAGGRGVREMHQTEFKHGAPLKKHPAAGLLKGSFVIRDWDVTKPALDAEEYADWEANLLRKTGQVKKGSGGKK